MPQPIDSSAKFIWSGNPLGSFRQLIAQRFKAWMLLRLTPARQHVLNNKRLFIVPSRAGLGFLTVVILLWLTGTNFENNVVLALAFFLTALFVVSIHHTFFNMAGLKIEGVRTSPCFQGEGAEVELRISCRKGAEKENIGLQFEDASPVIVDLIHLQTVVAKLYTPGLHRGWYWPPRLKVISHYPLGIIRCWSWLALDLPILVYPRPIPGGEIPVISVSDAQEGNCLAEQGAEDFHGFKHYEVGVSPKHIAWKHYARGQGLYSKEYASYQEPKVWLDWDALDGVGKELRLSRLCYWVLKLSATQQPYGLRLPGISIPPATGVEHKQQILKTLALYRPRKASPDRASNVTESTSS